MKQLLHTLAALVSLMPAVALGQAGLFWDNSEKIRTSAGNGWDSGNRGTSALGQLESVAGRKVDTSRVPAASQPEPVRPKVHKPPTLSMKQQVGLMLFESLFEQVLSDASGNNQAANAQQLEQQRIAAELKRQEDLRKARLLHAHWRAEWDARDQQTTDQLSGAFDTVSSPAVGTSFFGIPGSADLRSLLPEVDPDATDTSVVDLRGATSLTVPLLSTPAQWTACRYPPASVSGDSGASSELRDYRELLDQRVPKPAQWALEWWWQQLPSIGWQVLRERSPLVVNLAAKFESLPGVSQAQAMYEYYENFQELRDGLSGQNEKTMALAFRGAQDFVNGSGAVHSYWDRFEQRATEQKEDAQQRSFDEVASKITEGFEADEIEESQASVVPLHGVGAHPDAARWQYHKLFQ